MGLSAQRRDAYLDDCRALTLEEIRLLVPQEGAVYDALYQLVLDYPMRGGKGLRPALCMATARALGGELDRVRRTAAVLELYHNAFLVHDDVEDESESRRGRPTLHQEHGVPVAINVGDAMLALSLQPLLENVEVLGLGAALRILRSVAHMTQESVEGQAIELHWIKRGTWRLEDDQYFDMVIKKTGWYSFITPMGLGCEAAGATAAQREGLEDLGHHLAIAFQIQDDVLNLKAVDGDRYGKESVGDLWEGKRTLILLHCLRNLVDTDRQRCLAILGKPRPTGAEERDLEAWLDRLDKTEGLPKAQRQLVVAEYLGHFAAQHKTSDDVAFLFERIQSTNSIQYAEHAAADWSLRAADQFSQCCEWLAPSVHRDFLESLVNYVHQRDL